MALFPWFDPKPLDHPSQVGRWFKGVAKQQPSRLREMLAAGMPLTVRNPEGDTALDMCAKRGLLRAATALTENGPASLADPEVLSPSALVEALRAHHFTTLLHLLKAGAPLHAVDVTGDNLLGVLVVQEHPSVQHINLAQGWAVEAFGKLLAVGVDPDQENHAGTSVRSHLHEKLFEHGSAWARALLDLLDTPEVKAVCQARALHHATPPAPSRPRPRF